MDCSSRKCQVSVRMEERRGQPKLCSVRLPAWLGSRGRVLPARSHPWASLPWDLTWCEQLGTTGLVMSSCPVKVRWQQALHSNRESLRGWGRELRWGADKWSLPCSVRAWYPAEGGLGITAKCKCPLCVVHSEQGASWCWWLQVVSEGTPVPAPGWWTFCSLDEVTKTELQESEGKHQPHWCLSTACQTPLPMPAGQLRHCDHSWTLWLSVKVVSENSSRHKDND